MSDSFYPSDETALEHIRAEELGLEVLVYESAIKHCETYQNRTPIEADLTALEELPVCFRGCKVSEPGALRPVVVSVSGWKVLKAVENPRLGRGMPLGFDTLETDDFVFAACWSCGPECASRIKARSAESVVLEIARRGDERATEGFVIARNVRDLGRVLAPVLVYGKNTHSAQIFRRDIERFGARGYSRKSGDAAWVRRTTALELVLLDATGVELDVTVQRGGPFHWWQRVAEASVACTAMGFPTVEDTEQRLPRPKVRILPRDTVNVAAYVADSFALSVPEPEPRDHFTLRNGTVLWQTYLTAGVAMAVLECSSPVDTDPRKLAQRAVSLAQENKLRAELASCVRGIEFRVALVCERELADGDVAVQGYLAQWASRLKPINSMLIARAPVEAIQTALEPLRAEYEAEMELDWGLSCSRRDAPKNLDQWNVFQEARRSVVALDAPREFRIVFDEETGVPMPFVPERLSLLSFVH